MMRFLCLLLMVASCAGQGLTLRSPLRDGAPPPASGASITVDFWQDFEFGNDGDNPTALQLEAAHAPYTNNWTIGGTTTLLIIRTAGQQAFQSKINGITDTGTRGLELDINGANTGARYAYMDCAGGANAVSWACRFKANSLITSATANPILSVVSIAGTIQTSFYIGTDGSGNPQAKFSSGVTNGAAITLTADTWYYATATSQNGTLTTLRVLDTDGATVGNSTATGTANDSSFFVIGNFNAYATEIGSVFVDNIIIDTTDATWPLAP